MALVVMHCPVARDDTERPIMGLVGMYPGIDPGPPGSDCAGVITHIAPGAPFHNLCPGDKVIGLAHGCLGTAVVAPAATLVKLPPGIPPSVPSFPAPQMRLQVAIGQSSSGTWKSQASPCATMCSTRRAMQL